MPSAVAPLMPSPRPDRARSGTSEKLAPARGVLGDDIDLTSGSVLVLTQRAAASSANGQDGNRACDG
jgi:hypothetical protein